MYFNPGEPEKNKVNYFLASHEYARTFFGEQLDLIISSAKDRKLLNEINQEISLDVSFHFTKSSGSLNSSNVVGVIEGTDKKDEYVFLTAHYHHL